MEPPRIIRTVGGLKALPEIRYNSIGLFGFTILALPGCGDTLVSCLISHMAYPYFIITTCVMVSIAILGLTLDPVTRFGYEAYFSTLIFGLASLVPLFVTYSRKELSLRQTLLRKVLHVIVLEALLIAFGFCVGILHGTADASFFRSGGLYRLSRDQ